MSFTVKSLTRKVANRTFRLLGSPSLYPLSRSLFHSARPILLGSTTALEAVSPRPAREPRPYREWGGVSSVDLSVILPVYRVERWLSPCLDSILSQESAYSFEVVAVDDGSPDSCGEMLDSYARRDPRVRVLHQKNRGFSGARNAGIDAARGRALTFVDSDDVMLSGAISSLMGEFESSSCDFVTASYKTIDREGIFHPIEGRRKHGAPWARVYDREIWQHLSFPEGMWFEDTVQAMYIDLVWRGAYVDVPVYGYRDNPAGITNTAGASKKGIDNLWVTEELLRWLREDGKDVGLAYSQTIHQFGPIGVARAAALSGSEMRLLFEAYREVLAEYFEGPNGKPKLEDPWQEVADALWLGDYRFWRVACALASRLLAE